MHSGAEKRGREKKLEKNNVLDVDDARYHNNDETYSHKSILFVGWAKM